MSPAPRVVSLVPSLTETALALGLDAGRLVGRTAWCVEPAEQLEAVPVVGGTKTPSLRSILKRRPDLVLLDREENRRETFEALEEAGIRTFVARVTQVADVPPMLEELGEALGRGEAGRAFAQEVLQTRQQVQESLAGLGPGPLALPLIWHEPLMALARSRYGGDLVAQTGFRLPDLRDPGGYPRTTPGELAQAGVELLLLTSEPHEFTREEGEALADAVAAAGARRPRARLVDGQALTWFGARTAQGLRWWGDLRLRLERSS